MHQRERRRRTVAIGALLLCSGIGAVAALRGAPDGTLLAPWWPPSGLGLAALLLCPRERLTACLSALGGVLVVGNLVGGHGLGLSLALTLADLVETGLIALLLHRRRPAWQLRSLDDAWDLGSASLLGVGVGAGLITLITAVTGTASGMELIPGGGAGATRSHLLTFGAIYLSHLSSIAVLVPLVCCFFVEPAFRVPVLEAIPQVVTFATLTLVLLWVEDAMALTWLPIAVLVWAAVRLGTRITVVEVWLLAIAIQLAVRIEQGPYVSSMSWTANTLIGEAYSIGLVLTSVPLALLQVDHIRTVADLRDNADDLARETRFGQAILDATADLVLVVRHNGEVVSANRTCSVLTGFTSTELLGWGWRKLTPPELRHHGLDRWRQIRDHSGVELADGIELEIVVRDGSRRRVLARSVPLTDEDGTYVVVGLDITEARNAAGWLMHILRTPSTTAIIGCDLDGEVLIFSRGAELLTGTPATEAVGRPVTELLHDPATGEQPPTAGDVLGAAAADGEPFTRDWQLGSLAGGRLLASLTVSVIHDAYGVRIGYLVVGQDMTSEREAARRLEELDAARNEFISTASHEIRTPMTSVIGYTEILADGSTGELSQAQQELVDAISRNGRRLLGLADELLTVARFDAGSRAASTERIDLATVLLAAMHGYSGAAQAGGITMSSHLPSRPLVIEGNASDTERVLVNLISNAVKFTPRGGTVECELFSEGDLAVVRVHDTGMGIPDDDVARIFDRFYRSGNAVRGAVQGTGLGLSIAASILQERGGSIDVRSVEGRGSTFIVRLPLAP